MLLINRGGAVQRYALLLLLFYAFLRLPLISPSALHGHSSFSLSSLTLRHPDVSSAGSLSCDGVFTQRSFMVRFFSGRRGDRRRGESALLRQVRRQRRTPKGESEKDGGGQGVRRRTTARFRWERKDRKTLFTQTVSTVSFRSTSGRDRGGMPLKV